MYSQKQRVFKQKEERRPSAFEKLRNRGLKGASSQPGQKVLICPDYPIILLLGPNILQDTS